MCISASDTVRFLLVRVALPLPGSRSISSQQYCSPFAEMLELQHDSAARHAGRTPLALSWPCSKPLDNGEGFFGNRVKQGPFPRV